MRSLSPLSRRILKKAGIAAAFFCSAFLFGSVLSHFTCRALRKAAPVFLSAAPETPVSSVSMPVLSSAAENWGLSFPEKGKTPVGNATSGRTASLLSLSIMTKPGGNRFTEQKIFSFFFHIEPPGNHIRLPGGLVSQREGLLFGQVLAHVDGAGNQDDQTLDGRQAG